MSANDLPVAHVYHIDRWDCPECGEVHESDAAFGVTETCDNCKQEVIVQ